MSQELPKILVVDDLRANRIAMRHLLGHLDVSIVEVDNGNDALAATLDNEFAVILLDVQMPEMDGFEVAQFLRDEERTQSVPIIFVTAALTDELDRLKGYNVGAIDYIMKPISEPILMSKVSSFVDMYQNRRRLQETLAALDQRNAQLESEIQERRRAEAEARHLATHDALTGLPNRLLFMDRLHSALARAHRDGSRFALGYMDLDGFKGVNDSLGHAAGDALLQEVARRLKKNIRESDTVARLGGDEFAVIFHEVGDADRALEIAEKLWHRVSGRTTVPAGDGEAEANIGMSIGIALYPEHGQQDDQLINAADQALYGVKKRGKAGCGVFDSAV